MGKYYIEGEVGPDNIEVRTETLDLAYNKVVGMKIAFGFRGWENVEIKEVDNDG